MLDPTPRPPKKKDIQHPRAKEKPQQDNKRGKISFRVKSYTCQRHSDDSKNTLCNQGTPQRLRPFFECLRVPEEVRVSSGLL